MVGVCFVVEVREGKYEVHFDDGKTDFVYFFVMFQRTTTYAGW